MADDPLRRPDQPTLGAYLSELQRRGWVVVSRHESSGLPQALVTELGMRAMQAGRWLP